MLNRIADEVNERVFDLNDAITDSNALYERMERGDHRQRSGGGSAE